jgi:hypothetical protein
VVEEETLIWPEVKHKNRIGQLIMCDGTTCGKAEKGAIPVPKSEFKRIIKEEGMKSTFKFTVSECLGVCTPHNVLCMLTKTEQIWLGMFRDPETYEELKKWLRDSHKAGEVLPLPESLKKHQFDRFKFE